MHHSAQNVDMLRHLRHAFFLGAVYSFFLCAMSMIHFLSGLFLSSLDEAALTAVLTHPFTSSLTMLLSCAYFIFSCLFLYVLYLFFRSAKVMGTWSDLAARSMLSLRILGIFAHGICIAFAILFPVFPALDQLALHYFANSCFFIDKLLSCALLFFLFLSARKLRASTALFCVKLSIFLFLCPYIFQLIRFAAHNTGSLFLSELDILTQHPNLALFMTSAKSIPLCITFFLLYRAAVPEQLFLSEDGPEMKNLLSETGC